MIPIELPCFLGGSVENKTLFFWAQGLKGTK